MHQLRFLLYGVVVILLLSLPLLTKEKKVAIKQQSTLKSVNVTLIKPEEKRSEKPQKKKVVKKKVVKKKIVKKSTITKKISKKKKSVTLKPKKTKKIIKEEQKTEINKKLEEKKSLQKKIENEKYEKIKREKAKSQERQKKAKYLNSIKEKYYAQIYNTIASYKYYPKRALRFKKEGVVKVSFTILSDGSYKNFKIITPSDKKIFNKAVQKLFRKLQKFEKPPSEIELPLNITININYKIRT